jgi:hypothetical protein
MTIRISRKGALSQARSGRKLWPTAVRIALAASPSVEIAAPKMTIVFHMADDGFNGGSAS